jgi:LPXTG-motif cell wall-anchored protein
MNSGGIVSGWQGGVPIDVPVTACGDQASVGGIHDTTDTPVCIMPSSSATETGIVENSGGILSGDQASVPIYVPVHVCGDEVTLGLRNTTGSPVCSTTPPTTPPPTTPPPTTPPPTTPPPTTPPPTTPPPTTAPPTTAPPTTMPPTGMPSTMPPHGPGTPPPGGPGGHGPGSLAHTGGEEGVALALGAGALLAGVGIRVASKRRSQR